VLGGAGVDGVDGVVVMLGNVADEKRQR
jgi:hypothetical protein